MAISNLHDSRDTDAVGRILEILGGFDSATRARVVAAVAVLIEAPTAWLCGCGSWNGINLATCRVCGRREDQREPC